MLASGRASVIALSAVFLGACGGGGTQLSTGTAGTGGAGGATGGGGTTSATGATGGAGGSTTSATGATGGGRSTSSGTGGAPAACSGKPGQTGDSNIKLTFGGVERNADVHVPAKYDPTVPTTLVLNFHGYSDSAVGQAKLSKMSDASDARGFIVVYPSGIGSSWNAGVCCGTAATTKVDDVGFVSALIDELASQYCIDPKRVFSTGMSNGGFLSNRLGCELSDKIAAIAPVAGDIGIPLDSCNPPRKVPVMHFHGTSDLVVPFDGSAFLGFPPVKDSVGRWITIDGCGAETSLTYEKGDAKCATSQGCGDGTEVTLCTIDGGGHTWPGGMPVPALGKTSMDLDATNAMLDFFEKHPMP